MSDAEAVDLLADLKRRFALGTLTYAEAVVIEDLIAIVPEVNSEAGQALAELSPSCRQAFSETCCASGSKDAVD